MDLKNWLFPTIVFCIFAYGITFLVVYAYRPNSANYDISSSPNSVTNVQELRDALQKTMQ